LLKKSETCRWLGNEPTTCSALRGEINTASGALPAFPELPTPLNSIRNSRLLQGFCGFAGKNLGVDTAKNSSIALIFNGLAVSQEALFSGLALTFALTGKAKRGGGSSPSHRRVSDFFSESQKEKRIREEKQWTTL